MEKGEASCWRAQDRTGVAVKSTANINNSMPHSRRSSDLRWNQFYQLEDCFRGPKRAKRRACLETLGSAVTSLRSRMVKSGPGRLQDSVDLGDRGRGGLV